MNGKSEYPDRQRCRSRGPGAGANRWRRALAVLMAFTAVGLTCPSPSRAGDPTSQAPATAARETTRTAEVVQAADGARAQTATAVQSRNSGSQTPPAPGDSGSKGSGSAPQVADSATRPLLKGRVTYLVPRGTPIKLKLASVPTSGLRLGDRDLEGNLYPAQLNQEITARTSEDLYVDDNKVIPEGTVFYGKVTKIFPPRRVGRPGWLSLTFDSFQTPDGRRFAFRVEADTFRKSTAKTKAKGFGLIAAHAAGGAIVGALIAYQLFGLENTLAVHGYNIAGGAAAGALAATAYAIMRRGPQAVLEPGDDLNMEINTDLLLPAATEPTAKKAGPHLDGLEVEILKSKVKRDGLGGHYLQLETLINNETDKRFSSLDLFLEDDNGQRFSICPSLDEDSEVNFQVEPHSIKRVKFAFQVEYPKLKRKLVWLDHRTQHTVMTMRLP
ncbi:MAG TPA: hypothetical protein V6D08_13990 [Candidatus Obscuribacterales bacterium]